MEESPSGGELGLDGAALFRHADGSAGVQTLYVEQGSPWENGYAESSNSRFRDELMAREGFKNVPERGRMACGTL